MKVEKVIGYTVQVTSKGEQYTLTGNVNVEGMSLTNISAAVVKKTDTQDAQHQFPHGNVGHGHLQPHQGCKGLYQQRKVERRERRVRQSCKRRDRDK